MPQEARTHHLLHSSTPSASGSPPTSIQVDHLSRHNTRQSKMNEENIPNDTSNFTMKKMALKLPIPSTHTTFVNHNDMLLLEIVHSKDFSYGHWPNKKGQPQRDLSLPNTLPREMKTIFINHDIVEGFNTKQSSFERGPPHLVLPFPSHSH